MHQPKSPLFYHGNRQNYIKHAQLRMNCSKLNHHLYLLHVSDSPACPCGFNTEDTNHYLLQCPLFHQDRIRMYLSIGLICDLEITCSLLLVGSDNLDLDANRKIFDFVHMFIESSGRL